MFSWGDQQFSWRIFDDIEGNQSDDEMENVAIIKSDEVFNVFHKLKILLKLLVQFYYWICTKLNKVYEEINGKDKILRYYSFE